MKKSFLSLLLIFATLTAAIAAKAPCTPIQKQQPDGTIVTIQVCGDEHFSWLQTTDGVLLVQEGNAYYVAKADFYGSLVSTGVLAHDAALRTLDEVVAIEKQDKDEFFNSGESMLKSKRTSLEMMPMAIPGYPSAANCPHIGKVRIPIILMEYTDMKFSLDQAVYENYFNGTTKTPYTDGTRYNGYSSVAEYYREASNGLFEPVFELYGPYTANRNHDYYGKKSGRNIITILTEAVGKADKDIDFSQYDSNKDGKVDMVYVFYAGTGANISGNDYDVWPACYPGNQNISTSDGVRITTIGGANELLPTTTKRIAGIGVTIHEMNHGLGLPDLYNTGEPHNPETGRIDWSNCGPEDWDIMDGGENIYGGIWPCQFNAWERDVMGWMTIEELTEPQDITIYPLNDSRGKAYRITNPFNTNEYYIIENNNTSDWNYYQRSLYGTGLMVYHLNAKSTGFAMTPNNTYGKPNITIVPADGYIMGLYNRGETIIYNGQRLTMPTNDTEFRNKYFNPESQGDHYPGSKNVTEVSLFKNYTGTDLSKGYTISNITKNEDGSIFFRFDYKLGDVNADGEVNMNDANNVANYSVGSPSNIVFNTSADMNLDGKIDMEDAKLIMDSYLSK